MSDVQQPLLSPLAGRSRWRVELLEAHTALGARFAILVEGARQKYPQLEFELEPFASHVAGVVELPEPEAALGAIESVERALGTLHMDDLYLACACGLGKPKALSVFEANYLQPLRTFVRAFDASDARLDELKQLLRERLLLGADGQPPRIARYAGRGTLAAWVQVAAQRLALSALRRQSPEAPTADGQLTDLMAADPDPELLQLRLRHAHEFREALRSALSGLEASERVLLRLHSVEGISLSRIAVSYHVSQSTASRWYAQIRERIHDETKRHLRQLISVDSDEFESLARLLQSQLDLSLSRLLRSTAD